MKKKTTLVPKLQWHSSLSKQSDLYVLLVIRMSADVQVIAMIGHLVAAIGYAAFLF